ncbi:MAG: hypothetical protein HYZ53_07835 [Planctomycetes bacterium]|nr:hypothetical protein [Planctomycetota bacterium]
MNPWNAWRARVYAARSTVTRWVAALRLADLARAGACAWRVLRTHARPVAARLGRELAALCLPGARVVCFSHEVFGAGGGRQQDPRVFPRSAGVGFRVVVSLPTEGPDATAVPVLRLVDPTGRIDRTLCATSPSRWGWRVSASFLLDDAHRWCATTGVWRAEAALSAGGPSLAQVPLRVVSREELAGGLEAVDAGIVEVYAGEARRTVGVLSDADLASPCVRFRSPGYPPEACEGLPARVALVRAESGERYDARETTLRLQSGLLTLGEVLAKPIAADPLFAEGGAWEFRVEVTGRRVATVPFQVATPDEARAAVSVERLALLGLGGGQAASSKGWADVGETVDRAAVPELAPAVTLRAAHPNPRVRVELGLGLRINGRAWPERVLASVSMESSRLTLPLCRLPLADLPPSRDPLRCALVLFVNGRFTAARDFAVAAGRPACADSQGRLVRPWSDADVDYGAEAARLLAEALRAG